MYNLRFIRIRHKTNGNSCKNMFRKNLLVNVLTFLLLGEILVFGVTNSTDNTENKEARTEYNETFTEDKTENTTHGRENKNYTETDYNIGNDNEDLPKEEYSYNDNSNADYIEENSENNTMYNYYDYDTFDEIDSENEEDDPDYVYDPNLLECNSNDILKLYLLEGEKVYVSNYSGTPPDVSVERCNSRIKVSNVLNPSSLSYTPELYLLKVHWPTLSGTPQLERATLKNVTPHGVWGDCSLLNTMHIEWPNLTFTSPDWLANCTELQELYLVHVTVLQMRFILDSAPHVYKLNVRYLIDIAQVVHNPIFPSARGAHQWINRFELENFRLGNIDDFDAQNTTEKEMSQSLVYQLSLLPRLEVLELSHIAYFDFCASVNNLSVTFQSLEELRIWFTNTETNCFKEHIKLPKIKEMNLVQNYIRELKFGELFTAPSPQLYVNLDSSDVQQFVFQRADYLALIDGPQQSNVTLYKFRWSIECDCGQSLWLARALFEDLVTAPLVTCRDGSSLLDQACDWLYCDRVDCNSTCVCCHGEPETVVGDCRDANISAIPTELLNWSNLTALLIPNSKVTTLPGNLPKTLTWLDLSGNDILRHWDAEDAAKLFAVPERHFLLNGNTILCSCDYQQLLNELQLHKDQIDDYGNLTCAGSNTKLSEVNVASLCAARNQQRVVTWAVSILLASAVAFLLLGVLWYYRQQLRVYLFARGWCLCCIHEEELDADRQYDVFLSFCYDDERVVMEELLPNLDREYSVCVHYRDWCPGDMIPTQITRSVEESRRTLVVLSRNFVKSIWGLLEFRTAHVSGLIEGRVRVVMVVLDDVLDGDDLEGEIKAYVRLNTYVKWGDPWFWEKLKFALPHTPSPPSPPNAHMYDNEVIIGDQQPHIEMLEM